MKTILLFGVLALSWMLSSCAAPEIKVATKRSLELTDSRVAGGGTLCVVTHSKVQGIFPSENDRRQTKIAEDHFRSKGYKIHELPPNTDYGFLIFTSFTQMPASSATLIGDTAFLDNLYANEMRGELYALKPNGSPSQLLWRADAHQIVSSVDSMATGDVLLQRILDKFPN